MKSLWALRHVAFEDLGAMAPAFRAAGYEIRYIEAGVEDLTGLDPLSPDVLVALGGPIGVYQDDLYPFLGAEITFLEKRLSAGRPVMGVCLGAQLMARALDAKVYPSGGVEIGFGPIDLTAAGRASCLAPFAARPVTLHWHGDTFDLPEGATRLAASEACRNQAFEWGGVHVGFQFHPEIDPARIEQWLIGHCGELHQHGVDITALRRAAASYQRECRDKAADVARRWLAGLE